MYMERNSIISALQIKNPASLYESWRETSYGLCKTYDDFFSFITTPSVDRDRFYASLTVSRQFDGNVLVSIIENNVV